MPVRLRLIIDTPDMPAGADTQELIRTARRVLLMVAAEIVRASAAWDFNSHTEEPGET